jgi:hypothetical protein
MVVEVTYLRLRAAARPYRTPAHVVRTPATRMTSRRPRDTGTRACRGHEAASADRGNLGRAPYGTGIGAGGCRRASRRGLGLEAAELRLTL